MDAETFTLLPIHLDPQTKSLSASGSSVALQEELIALNTLHRQIVGLDTPNSVPPPPVPVNPKRSAQIAKLKDTGNTSFRKGQYADAIRMYSLGVEMALGRPSYEPVGLVREEVSQLYSNRAQAHMSLQHWPEGAVDAECSVECKQVGNSKAWWRRGKCLLEMGRLDEAKEWVGRGLQIEGGEQDLVGLMKEVDAALEKRRV